MCGSVGHHGRGVSPPHAARWAAMLLLGPVVRVAGVVNGVGVSNRQPSGTSASSSALLLAAPAELPRGVP